MFRLKLKRLLLQLNKERYRSGHNEAVLKTVCPQGRVGSNPTLSVSFLFSLSGVQYISRYGHERSLALFSLLRKNGLFCVMLTVIRKNLEKYPRG